ELPSVAEPLSGPVELAAESVVGSGAEAPAGNAGGSHRQAAELAPGPVAGIGSRSGADPPAEPIAESDGAEPRHRLAAELLPAAAPLAELGAGLRPRLAAAGPPPAGAAPRVGPGAVLRLPPAFARLPAGAAAPLAGLDVGPRLAAGLPPAGAAGSRPGAEPPL